MLHSNVVLALLERVGCCSLTVLCNRRQELYDRDPVNHMKLSEFLRTQLASCAAVHGAAFHTAFSRLPATLAEQVKAAVGEKA